MRDVYLDYMTTGTKMPQHIPFPRFLLDRDDLSQTAKIIYSVLLYRTTLSKKNGWIDEQGRVYIIFPLESIMETVHKSRTPVKNAMRELYESGLVERTRTHPAPNMIYVKIPENAQTDEKASCGGSKKRPSEGLKTAPPKAGKQTLNGLKQDPEGSKIGLTIYKEELKERVKRESKYIAAAPAALSEKRTPMDVFTEFAKDDAPLLKALTEFDQYRQEIRKADKKKTWTALGATKICEKLKQLTREAKVKDRTGYMIAVLSNSIENGWTGVFAAKGFADHDPARRFGGSMDSLNRSLARSKGQPEPDRPRKITKDMSLEELIMGGGIMPDGTAPAGEKGNGQHE